MYTHIQVFAYVSIRIHIYIYIYLYTYAKAFAHKPTDVYVLACMCIWRRGCARVCYSGAPTTGFLMALLGPFSLLLFVPGKGGGGFPPTFYQLRLPSKEAISEERVWSRSEPLKGAGASGNAPRLYTALYAVYT